MLELASNAAEGWHVEMRSYQPAGAHIMQAQDLVRQFVEKWRAGTPASELNERAGAQAHFIDLCRALEVPEPGDPHNYCSARRFWSGRLW